MFHILWILTDVIMMTCIHHCSVLQKSFTALEILCSAYSSLLFYSSCLSYLWICLPEQIMSVVIYKTYKMCFWKGCELCIDSGLEVHVMFFLQVWIMMVRYCSLICDNFFLNWNHLENSEVILQWSKDNRWSFSSFTLNRFAVKLFKI